MTTHYLDLRVVPDPETSAPQLLGALYNHLHLALVAQHIDAIGVSFPGYGRNPRTLGDVLRLHAEEAALRQFMQTDWLKGMRDHLRLTEVAPAPPDAEHRAVHRRQFKTSAERLRRRRMRRKGETAEQAREAIPSKVERQPDLPFIHLHSRSTHQAYCLFIDVGPARTTAVPGVFNSYGLSTTSTIPWF